MGELQVMRSREKDTFIDVAQAYDLGYDEMLEANPGVDPWLPGEGTELVPPREGIVLNVVSKRLFWYPKVQKSATPVVHTFPISIGREGWATPLGRTRVTRKKKAPVWRVPASIRKEHAEAGGSAARRGAAGAGQPARCGFPVAIMAGSQDAVAGVAAARRVQNVVTYDWFTGEDAVLKSEATGAGQ